MSYADYQSKLAPGFLRNTNGRIWEETLGAEKDVQLDVNRQAVIADLPGTGPVDGLDLIGADRVLPRATGESDVAYAERLRTSWDAADGNAFRGSHGGMLKALARAGFPTGLASGAVIIQRTKRYSYISSGTVTFGVHGGWSFNDQGPQFWNQFGIIFGGDVAGLDVGTASALRLDAIVKAWKPAKARFMGTRVIVSGTVWGWPLGVEWGDVGRDWDAAVTRFIPPL